MFSSLIPCDKKNTIIIICMYKKITYSHPLCGVQKDYVSFFRKRCRARFGRPAAGLRARRPKAAWRARRVGKKFEQFYTWWVGSVMDSTLVFDKRGTRFDSRSLQILLTSFFLLCQVLSKTNFPCMYKKTTSTLFYVPSFVRNKFPLHINIKLSLWMYEKTTSNSPCECTKKRHKLF